MAATDGRPVPIKNVAYRVTFPILDADGDLVTAATGLDSEISKDGGTFTDVSPGEATEIASGSGMYFLDLTSTEMNADTVCIIVKTSTGGAKTTPIVMYPEEAGDIRVDVTEWAGVAPSALISGRVDSNPGALQADVITAAAIAANAIGSSELATDAIGDAQIATGAIASTAFAAGAINAAAIAADAITAAKIATDAITNAKIAADAIGASEIADGAIDAATFAAGAIDATAIATGAIDADAIAADAVTELRSLVSGTSDSGSSTTMVDALRTEVDDVWNGCWIMSTSGATANQIRLITNFDAASDPMTFAPAMTASIATSTYEILPAGAVDIQSWLGTVTALVAPNALVGGAVDADVSALQAAVITATSIASNAIEAAKIATDAITAAKIAAGAIDAATFAASAIDAAALATDAVNEIRDAILSDSTSFAGANVDAAITTRATPAQVNTEVVDVLKTDTITLPAAVAPPLAPTFEELLSHLYKAYRNRKTQTATQWSLMADDESTVQQKATVSDDATTAIKQEIVAGP